MQVRMIMPRFTAGGVLAAAGATVDVSDQQAQEWIGSGVAVAVTPWPTTDFDPDWLPPQTRAGQALVSGAAKKLTGSSRLGGGTAAGTGAQSFSGDRTFCLKKEAEAHYDSCRLHLYHRETSASTVFRALVAATETASLASVAVAGQPTVGGTQTAALRSAVGQPGWASVTWGGASSVDLPAAASSMAPSVVSSDWIELPSVPRADGGVRPLLMVRLYHSGATTGPQNLIGGLITDSSADQTAWQNESSRPWWRVYQNLTITTTDGVSAPATNVPGTTLGNSTPWMAIEYGFRVPAISVLGLGDSLTENSTFTWGSFGTWGLRGCMLASTPEKPVTWFNAGMSGQANSVWIAAGEAAIALHQPTHVLYQLLSPNSPDVAAIGALTDAERTLMLARLQRIARACRAVRAKLVVWSGIPNNAYTLASDGFRQLLNQAAAATAASGGFDYLNLESVVSNGASPARMVSSFDNTHPNNPLLDAMSLSLRDYLRTQHV